MGEQAMVKPNLTRRARRSAAKTLKKSRRGDDQYSVYFFALPRTLSAGYLRPLSSIFA
jgi:hypothetical protein